jgi:hypothetical protein
MKNILLLYSLCFVYFLSAQSSKDTLVVSPQKVQYKIDIGMSVSNQSIRLKNVFEQFPLGGLVCFRAHIPKWRTGLRYRAEIWFPLSSRQAAYQSHTQPRVSHYYIHALDVYKDIPISTKNPFDLRVGAGLSFITPYWENPDINGPLSLADIFVSVPFGYSALELIGQYAWNDNKPAMFQYSYINLSWYYSFPRKYPLKEQWVKK